jgi:hypothetical protein
LILARGKNFFPKDLGLTQPVIQWVLGVPSLGIKLTAYVDLMLSIRINGAIPPSPYIPSRCAQGLLVTYGLF